MIHGPYSEQSEVLLGAENNPDVFVRRVQFDKDYSENDYHNHPNTYEIYIILQGKLTFMNETNSIEAKSGDLIYFSEAEEHKISLVDEKAEMLLIKKVGSEKIQ